MCLYIASTEPLNLMAGLVEKRRIPLTWTEPDMPNGIISQYMVRSILFSMCSLNHLCTSCIQITAVGTKTYNTSFNETRNFSATTSSTDLTDLTPGTLYRISVVAINGAGQGAESAPLEAMTLNGNANIWIFLPDIALPKLHNYTLPYFLPPTSIPGLQWNPS